MIPNVPHGSRDNHMLIFVLSYAIYDIMVDMHQSLYKEQQSADLVWDDVS